MTRGDVWLAQVGQERRPVVVLTRPEVIDVRELVTVAEITTSIRGLSTEVPLDTVESGVTQPAVVNCDGIHTVRQSSLSERVGALDARTMTIVCDAARHAIGC